MRQNIIYKINNFDRNIWPKVEGIAENLINRVGKN
jgi:hypothetical protein